jgi:hypothetical protein
VLVFIDESGDPGFKTDKGATPIFVVAMVIFTDTDAAEKTQKTIDIVKSQTVKKQEFKFSKCDDGVRDAFFQAVRGCPFLVRAIVVKKEIIYSPRLRTDKDKFYEYFVNQMMRHDDGLLTEARVVIDGSGDREFRQNLNAAMRRKLGSGVIKDVRFKDSNRDVLVQLADMCAGAIARSFRQDRRDARRWRDMLSNRINDVWEFR